MAINKAVLKAIKAISFAHIDVKNKYQQVRNMYRLAHPFVESITDKYIYTDSTVGDVPVRVFYPDRMLNNDVLIFFHGGGWVIGDVESYSQTCAMLCQETGRRVVAVEYGLAPEYKFPKGLNDCYTVAKEFALHRDEFGLNAKHIILIGDSAGGNLSTAVSLMAKDSNEFKIDAQILIYPAVFNDHTEKSPFKSVHECGKNYFLTSKRVNDYMEMYAQNPEDYNNPLFAPLLSENLENMPPSLIITAQYDPLRDEGEAYAHKLEIFGNSVEMHRVNDALHGFITLPLKFRIVEEGFEYIKKFLDEVRI